MNLPKLKRRFASQIWVPRILILTFFIFILFFSLKFISKTGSYIFNKLLFYPYIVTTFFSNPLYTLPSYHDRTNLLIFIKEDQIDEVQVILFLTLDLKQKKLYQLFLPTEIWVPSFETPLKTLYQIGNRDHNDGFTILEAGVYEVVNQPIHYILGFDHGSLFKLSDLPNDLNNDQERLRAIIKDIASQKFLYHPRKIIELSRFLSENTKTNKPMRADESISLLSFIYSFYRQGNQIADINNLNQFMVLTVNEDANNPVYEPIDDDWSDLQQYLLNTYQ